MLYLIGFFLLFILLLLVIVFFVYKKPKRSEVETAESDGKQKPVTLQSLVKTLKTEKANRQKIEGIVDQVLNDFPFPDNEKDANEHFEFVYFYAKNPLTTAKMIVEMQKRLSQKNPKYAKQIEDFQMRGVEARTK